MKKAFGDHVTIATEQDVQTRGAFEVSLCEELLHSKLTRSNAGDARCETEEEVGYIIAKISAALGLV